MLRCGYGSVLFLWMFRQPRMPLLVGVSLENNRQIPRERPPILESPPPSAQRLTGVGGVYSNGSMSSRSRSEASASVSAAVLELDAAAELN